MTYMKKILNFGDEKFIGKFVFHIFRKWILLFWFFFSETRKRTRNKEFSPEGLFSLHHILRKMKSSSCIFFIDFLD